MMQRQQISLEVSHPSLPTGRIQGFRFIWAFYVKGYDPSRHCQPCFRGRRVPEFCTPTATSGKLIEFDRMDVYPYLYICGVGAGRRDQLRQQNLHLPLRFEAGGIVDRTTYNGYRFRVANAALVDVPSLPDDFGGKTREHARCRNFQFGVAAFGYPPSSQLTDGPGS